MNNLTRLFNREDNWYKIGPISIGRGIPKRVPFYFVVVFLLIFLLSFVPLTPFWLLLKVNDGGWIINYLVLPVVGTALLQTLKTGGKKPEKYLLTLVRFHSNEKCRNPYKKIDRPTIYTFGTVYTHREIARREEDST